MSKTDEPARDNNYFFRQLLHELIELPQAMLSELYYYCESPCLYDFSFCKRCGLLLINCSCQNSEMDIAHMKPINHMELAYEGVNSRKIHYGPKRIDGLPDQRYHSHTWHTLVEYYYTINLEVEDGTTFQTSQYNDEPLNIKEVAKNFNIF